VASRAHGRALGCVLTERHRHVRIIGVAFIEMFGVHADMTNMKCDFDNYVPMLIAG
jgi:hypothetical protein